MKLSVFRLIVALLLVPLFVASQNFKEELLPVQFELLHINVPDKKATAQWYVDNVGLEIIQTNDDQFIYVADKDRNFMLELSSFPGIRNTYHDIDIDGFHLAFEGHKSIYEIAEKMLANGGTQEGVLYTNKIGDYVMNIRDPNGFVCQLIHRVDPFFTHSLKSNIRFEHFAFNTPDQKTAALWYVEFMGLVIPWSKDIDKSNLYRNYRVPYVGDKLNKMSFELFGKDIESSLLNMPHEVIHIGFLTETPERFAGRLKSGGATIVGDKKFNNNGDMIIDLYDPDKVPIRLTKRNHPILH